MTPHSNSKGAAGEYDLAKENLDQALEILASVCYQQGALKRLNPPKFTDLMFVEIGVVKNKITNLIKSRDRAIKERLLAEGPKDTNGKELNIAASATSLVAVDPRIVKIAQGEGWDQANYQWKAIIQRIFNGGKKNE